MSPEFEEGFFFIDVSDSESEGVASPISSVGTNLFAGVVTDDAGGVNECGSVSPGECHGNSVPPDAYGVVCISPDPDDGS